MLVDPPSGTRRRTFLFSATLAFAAAGTSSDMAETLVRAKLAARARADKRRAGTEGGGDLVAAQEGSRQADRVTKKARRRMLEEARRTSALVGLLRHVGASDHPAMVRVAKASEVEAASAVASEEAMESLAKISLQVGEDVILRGEHALKPLSELVNASEAEQAPTKQSARIADSSKGTSAAAAAAKKRTAASALTLPSSLKLAKMSVAEDEKDAALYYFLSTHPGRTLVFVNRIGMTRRLAGLLGLLRMPVHALHAKMQQRQRLKSLERFQREDGSVLVATDVAARGLDIPGVTHVVHYDVAIDPETFVHRSGRTARASREGQALTLVDPASHSRYVRCCLACGLEGGMDTMEVDSRFKRQVDDRVYAAAQVWKIESKKTRAATKASWVQRQAGAMDMDVDELTAKEAGLSTRAMEGDSESDDESKVMRSREAKKEAKALKRWKGQLSRLLGERFLPAGVSQRFVADGSVQASLAGASSMRPGAAGPARGGAGVQQDDDDDEMPSDASELEWESDSDEDDERSAPSAASSSSLVARPAPRSGIVAAVAPGAASNVIVQSIPSIVARSGKSSRVRRLQAAAKSAAGVVSARRGRKTGRLPGAN